jgi:2-hydroxy-6-oxonona-2,4-dienedioate hydrolase
MSQKKARLGSIWTQVDDATMHARVSLDEAGHGFPPVVLVHGMVVSSSYMAPLAERLGRFRKVYAPDLPGYGRSDKPGHILDLPGLADALARWMECLELPPAAFIGNSFGCQVLAQFAVRHPQLVERLVLVGPTTDPRARSAPKLLARWSLEAPQESRMAPLLMKDYALAGVRRTLATFRMVLDSKIEEHARQIHQPVLVVRGSRDPVAPRQWVEELTATFPNARFRTVSGAAHAANFTSPTRLTRTVLPFLDEAPASIEVHP